MDYVKELNCLPKGVQLDRQLHYENISKAVNLFKKKALETDKQEGTFIGKELNLITYKQFEKHLAKVVAWINEQIRDEPYIIVTERLLEKTVDGTKCKNESIKDGCMKNSYKSSEWIFNTVRDELHHQPQHIVDIWDVDALKTLLRTTNIQNYVHFDDAIYSGTQKRDIFQTFFQYVSYQEEYDDEDKNIKVFMCVPFASDDGIRNIKSNVFGNIIFSPHKKMKSVSDFKIEYPDVDTDEVMGKAKTMTLFHHKLPDHLSFPKKIADILKTAWTMPPPYKCVFD
jgi:hypothetical protein